MIDVLTNGFLFNPIPIQFTGNYCSHGCTYCFANINNPKRKLDVKAVTSQLRNYKSRNDLPSFYMREKYPMLLSNNIDPFSKSNQPFCNDLIRTLTEAEIPVVLATRGGIGWSDIIDEMPPSVWYVTIPYNDDETRKQFEPNAPAIEERWELVQAATEKGHKVIVSINPLNIAFAPEPLQIAEKAKEYNASSLLINKLHLSPKQQANMTAREKGAVGEALLKEARMRSFKEDWLHAAIDLYEWCFDNDMNLMGFDNGLYNNQYHEFKAVYTNLLPTLDDFFNHIYETRNDGDLIAFDDFYNFFAPLLPNVEGNVSKYIFQKAIIDDKSFYKTMTIRNLLHLYWSEPKLGLDLANNYPAYSWAKRQTSTKLDFVYDKDHNKQLVYHKDEYNTSNYTLI